MASIAGRQSDSNIIIIIIMKYLLSANLKYIPEHGALYKEKNLHLLSPPIPTPKGGGWERVEVEGIITGTWKTMITE